MKAMKTALFFLVATMIAGCSKPYSAIGVPRPGPLEGSKTQSACAMSPIFILSGDTSGHGVLVSFDPSTATFDVRGRLSVPDGLEAGGPIAVDRAGQVYVVSNMPCGAEWIFRCDAKSLTCVPTPAAQSLSGEPAPDAACLESMAFVADPASPTGETLFYLAQPIGSGPELGRVDASTSALSKVAAFSAPQTASSVNGVAFTAMQAQLYAAFDAHPSLALGTEIDTVDTSHGTTTFDYQLNEVPPLSGSENYHAVATYGGNFYLFVQNPTDHTITVFEFQPSTAAVTTVAQTSGFPLLRVASSNCE